MKKSKISISSKFEIVGENHEVTIPSLFSVTSETVYPSFKPQSFDSSNKAITGVITYKRNSETKIATNALVVAYKDGIIYDYTSTNEQGEYFLYLENGIYDIKIQSYSISRMIKNQQIDDGIKTFNMMLESGQILEKIHDMIKLANSEELVHVSGSLVNENGAAVEGAEIVIADSDNHQVYAFVKTDYNGRYEFVTKLTNLDIVVRSQRFNAKSVRGFNFNTDSNGFMQEVIDNLVSFEKGGNTIGLYVE